MVSDGASLTSYRSHYKALRCMIWFCPVFNVLFYPNFWGRGAPRGSMMVPLDTELVSSYRLSSVNTNHPGVVWCLYHMAVICEAGFDWGKGWSYGVGNGSPR